MDEKKGVHLLLEALTYLRHQPLTVIIAYPKPTDSYAQAYLDQLRTQARQTAAPHHQLHFWQNPTNLAELYQVATMAILPSQQEMMPLVMLEALASGTPFLVPEVGGVLEILHPLKKQALLASTSPVSLARKIKWVLNLPASRKQHWKKTARRIAVQYTWEAQARKLLAILESVTSARPATRRQ
jgi:glycosyltransferase involved in cell wall biosynthesis